MGNHSFIWIVQPQLSDLKSVIDAMVTQDEQNHSNVHRGVHQLSQRSTEAYEGC